MKVGYSDTINNKAYQDKTSASPFKMVDKSKADLDKDGKVSEYESKRADAAFGETPLNMNGPLYARNKYTSFGEGEKYGPPSDEDKLPGQPDRHDDSLRGFKPDKPDKSDESDKTTGPGKVSTKTTRIVKSGGGTGGSTVGREVVKGIKKLVDKRKKRRAADPNIKAKKEGRIERREIKAEGKRYKKEEKAKVTREKNKDKLKTTKKKVYEESGNASRKSAKEIKEIKANRTLTGSPNTLYKEHADRVAKERKNKKN